MNFVTPPSFINKEHTSLYLNKDGEYQQPQFSNESSLKNQNKVKKLENEKQCGSKNTTNTDKGKKGKGGWDDDDNEEIKTSSTSNPNIKKNPWDISKEPNAASVLTPNSSNDIPQISNPNTIKPVSKPSLHENKPVVTTVPKEQKTFYPPIELEKQLIDNILAQTGISAKPSDMQFKDYLNRVKNLNKETINSLLHERLLSTEQSNDTKPLQRCLYVIEFSISNKIKEIVDYFKENYIAFEDIQTNYPGVKKISELTENILLLLGKKDKKIISGPKCKEEVRSKLIKGKGSVEASQQIVNNVDDIFVSSKNEDTQKSEINFNKELESVIDLGQSQNTFPAGIQISEDYSENPSTKQKKNFSFLNKKENKAENEKIDTQVIASSKPKNDLEMLFDNIDLTGGSESKNPKNDSAIHINQTSNINITVVHSGSNSLNGNNNLNQQQEKSGFSFVNKAKPKPEKEGSFQMNKPEDKQIKGKVDITELLNSVYDNSNITQMSPNTNTIPNNYMYMNQGGQMNNMNNLNPMNNVNPNNMNGIYGQGFQGYGYVPYQSNINQGYMNPNPPFYSGIGMNYGNYNNQMNYQQTLMQQSMFDKNTVPEVTQTTKPKDNKFSFIDEMMKPKNN